MAEQTELIAPTGRLTRMNNQLPVTLDWKGAVGSPWFWILVGGALASMVWYYAGKPNRK